MKTVTCVTCGHAAEVQAPSDAWRCNCSAGVSTDPGCVCDALNEARGTESNPPETDTGEVAELEARLAVLRGTAAPEGSATDG